ncbi:hypothetical protein TNCV_1478051 [Trichonephila clavipes]|nr:hypothetical protein TNCV_1478051 [Trichonephila clavipes]
MTCTLPPSLDSVVGEACQDEVFFYVYGVSDYAQVAKFLTASTTTQTDETITKIVCPPLKLLQALISIPKPAMSSRIPIVTKSSTSTQAHHLSSTSSVAVTTSS